MNNRIIELYELINKSELEIKAIRSQCGHSHYTVCWYEWRPGSCSPAQVCNNCGANIGTPAQEEEEKFLDEQRKPTVVHEASIVGK